MQTLKQTKNRGQTEAHSHLHTFLSAVAKCSCTKLKLQSLYSVVQLGSQSIILRAALDSLKYFLHRRRRYHSFRTKSFSGYDVVLLNLYHKLLWIFLGKSDFTAILPFWFRLCTLKLDFLLLLFQPFSNLNNLVHTYYVVVLRWNWRLMLYCQVHY